LGAVVTEATVIFDPVPRVDTAEFGFNLSVASMVDWDELIKNGLGWDKLYFNKILMALMARPIIDPKYYTVVRDGATRETSDDKCVYGGILRDTINLDGADINTVQSDWEVNHSDTQWEVLSPDGLEDILVLNHFDGGESFQAQSLDTRGPIANGGVVIGFEKKFSSNIEKREDDLTIRIMSNGYWVDYYDIVINYRGAVEVFVHINADAVADVNDPDGLIDTYKGTNYSLGEIELKKFYSLKNRPDYILLSILPIMNLIYISMDTIENGNIVQVPMPFFKNPEGFYQDNVDGHSIPNLWGTYWTHANGTKGAILISGSGEFLFHAGRMLFENEAHLLSSYYTEGSNTGHEVDMFADYILPLGSDQLNIQSPLFNLVDPVRFRYRVNFYSIYLDGTPDDMKYSDHGEMTPIAYGWDISEPIIGTKTTRGTTVIFGDMISIDEKVSYSPRGEYQGGYCNVILDCYKTDYASYSDALGDPISGYNRDFQLNLGTNEGLVTRGVWWTDEWHFSRESTNNSYVTLLAKNIFKATESKFLMKNYKLDGRDHREAMLEMARHAQIEVQVISPINSALVGPDMYKNYTGIYPDVDIKGLVDGGESVIGSIFGGIRGDVKKGVKIPWVNVDPRFPSKEHSNKKYWEISKGTKISDVINDIRGYSGWILVPHRDYARLVYKKKPGYEGVVGKYFFATKAAGVPYDVGPWLPISPVDYSYRDDVYSRIIVVGVAKKNAKPEEGWPWDADKFTYSDGDVIAAVYNNPVTQAAIGEIRTGVYISSLIGDYASLYYTAVNIAKWVTSTKKFVRFTCDVGERCLNIEPFDKIYILDNEFPGQSGYYQVLGWHLQGTRHKMSISIDACTYVF